MSELLPIEPEEEGLEPPATELIAQIRASLAIHCELLGRMLERDPRPHRLLAVMLETAGNRYIDFSGEVNAAILGAHKLNSAE